MDGLRAEWGSAAVVRGGGRGSRRGQGQVTLLSLGDESALSPDLGQVVEAWMEGWWGGVLQETFVLTLRWVGWREEGHAGGTGKAFEEQKQWPILCGSAWPKR